LTSRPKKSHYAKEFSQVSKILNCYNDDKKSLKSKISYITPELESFKGNWRYKTQQNQSNFRKIYKGKILNFDQLSSNLTSQDNNDLFTKEGSVTCGLTNFPKIEEEQDFSIDEHKTEHNIVCTPKKKPRKLVNQSPGSPSSRPVLGEIKDLRNFTFKKKKLELDRPSSCKGLRHRRIERSASSSEHSLSIEEKDDFKENIFVKKKVKKVEKFGYSTSINFGKKRPKNFKKKEANSTKIPKLKRKDKKRTETNGVKRIKRADSLKNVNEPKSLASILKIYFTKPEPIEIMEMSNYIYRRASMQKKNKILLMSSENSKGNNKGFVTIIDKKTKFGKTWASKTKHGDKGGLLLNYYA
jgi:hypothetical protein